MAKILLFYDFIDPLLFLLKSILFYYFYYACIVYLKIYMYLRKLKFHLNFIVIFYLKIR